MKGAEKMRELTYCVLVSLRTRQELLASTYSALQDTKSTLKDIHDWVINAFPVIDDFVIMNTSHNICRTVAFF